jgi:hypothetical protein
MLVLRYFVTASKNEKTHQGLFFGQATLVGLSLYLLLTDPAATGGVWPLLAGLLSHFR